VGRVVWGAKRGFAVGAIALARITSHAVTGTLLGAAASLVASGNLSAQTMWNGYQGSNFVPVTFATAASPDVSPRISLSVGGATAANFTFDTGSTGIEMPESVFCTNNNPQCDSKGHVRDDVKLGYAQITLTSSGATATGFYVNTTVAINNPSGITMATATVPVLIGPTVNYNQAGVGFGRPETAVTGVTLYKDSSFNTVVGTLYGRTLNPLLNLTSLSGQNLSSIAPGYVVTQNAVYLGLPQISSLMGPSVALTALPQTSSPICATSSGAFTCANSTYAQQATKFDWQTPPMLMQVSNNTVGINGNHYGTVVVDTGLPVGLITTGGTTLNGTTCTVFAGSGQGNATGCVNQALVQSATPTRIAISLGGAGAPGGPPAQFIYVYQGVCNSGTTTNAGCGPGGIPYSGNRASQMIPMYPTSGEDSYKDGYNGTNTGFANSTSATGAAFLNTGVNFLSYFNIVYDPVNGFIGYVPISGASAPQNLVSVTPVLALQGTQQPIPAGTVVPWPVYLFTTTGNQQISAPVDVVLSVENGGTATFNGPISSDTICTMTTCSTGLSTGLVLSQGTFVLNAMNTYAGATTVNSGAAFIVNGSIAASSGLTVDQGGAVGGTGILPTTTINGTLSPGYTIGGTPVIGTITVSGNLAFGPSGMYSVLLSPTASSSTNVTGTASLAGTVSATFSSDTYKRKSYTILHADGGLGATFNALTTSNLPTNFDANLKYTPTDVILDLTAHLGRGGNLARNHQGAADAISNAFNNRGDLPPPFQALFNLTGGSLVNALSLVSGEAATGAQQGAFQLGNQFLGVMLDPFVDGRGGPGGSGAPALAFAPEREPPSEGIALAYAKVLKAPPKPQTFEQRWSVWGGSYGGTNRTTGDPVVAGSHDLSARAVGIAAGLDYHFTRDTVAGFALAGGGTGWSLADGLGGGKSDAFQAGLYGATKYGSAYLAAAFAFTNHWMSTDRLAFAGDHLTASFNAQSYGGRMEGGYRFGTLYGGITPYAAIQAQSFHTAGYSEAGVIANGFALAFNGRDATDTRSELGARFDRTLALYTDAALSFRGRLAWAHDWVSDPTLAAAFQTLPGASFIVNGATPARDSALVSAGTEYRLANGVTLSGKFDGEFAAHSSTYAGTGTVRYTW
jgi:outer membrane autotransporter protein